MIKQTNKNNNLNLKSLLHIIHICKPCFGHTRRGEPQISGGTVAPRLDPVGRLSPPGTPRAPPPTPQQPLPPHVLLSTNTSPRRTHLRWALRSSFCSRVSWAWRVWRASIWEVRADTSPLPEVSEVLTSSARSLMCLNSSLMASRRSCGGKGG